MIIGNGLIATAFTNEDIFLNNDYVIFASGVSNSREMDDKQFNRESELLYSAIYSNKEKRIVYFSTCSISDKIVTPYISHKLKMENMITQFADKYNIFRLSQVAGNSSNNNLLLNYMISRINSGGYFELWEGSKRNIVDVDDVVKIVKLVLLSEKYHNQILDVTSPYTIDIIDIVELIEKFLKIKGNYTKKRISSVFNVDIEYLGNIVDLNPLFLNNYSEYLNKILKKYY